MRKSPGIAMLAAALVALTGVTGCRKRTPGATADAGSPLAHDAGPAAPRAATIVQVTQVTVDNLGWIEVVPRPSDDSVLAAAKRSLGERLNAPGVPGKLRVRVGLAPGKDGALLFAVALELTWREAGASEKLEARLVGEKTPDKGADMKALAQETLERAIGDAIDVLVKRDGIRRGDLQTVLAAIDDTDPDVRADAFRAVAERQMHAAAPRLIELLKDEDEDKRDLALGALVALREEKAVGAIVDSAQFNDIDAMRRIIDAVAQIGGSEAESYLELVVGGHEMAGVRQLAAEALARLRARKATTPAPAPSSSP